MVDRLPGARALNAVLWIVILVGLACALYVHWPWRPHFDQKATLSVLQSEQLVFLVTRRSKTQIVIEHRESDWAGEWRGILWATVSWRYGVDMKKLSLSDIRGDGQMTVIHLPDPELLDFALEPGSVGLMSKSTAVPKLQDFFMGGTQRQLLESQLREHALEFAQDQSLLPTRKEIVDQLNAASALLEKAAGSRLQFE